MKVNDEYLRGKGVSCEQFLAFQQVKYNVSDKIGNQLFRNRFNKLLVVLIDATLIL